LYTQAELTGHAPRAGHLPFEGDVPPCCKGREALCAGCTGVHKAQIKAAIAAGRLRPFGPQRLSPACTAFVSAMLLRDPKQRPSARQLLQVRTGVMAPPTLVSHRQILPACI
jgi:hypothetical protein